VIAAWYVSFSMSDPITEEEYNKASDAIHLEIGRAISEWSQIEQEIYHIFALLSSVTGASVVGLSTAFNEVHSFEQRLRMLTKLVQHQGISKTEVAKQNAEWRPIRRRLKDLNIKRNSLAHGCILSPRAVQGGPPLALPIWVPYYEELGFRLFKSGGTYENAPTFQELTAKDIAKIRSSITAELNPLRDFYVARREEFRLRLTKGRP
jgi:hypothetical protein